MKLPLNVESIKLPDNRDTTKRLKVRTNVRAGYAEVQEPVAVEGYQPP